MKIDTIDNARIVGATSLEINYEYNLRGLPTCLLFKLDPQTHERICPAAINLNMCQCNAIAALLDLPLLKVQNALLSHERGHALAWFIGSDSSEELAWELGKLYYLDSDVMADIDRIKQFCMNSHKANQEEHEGDCMDS